MADALSSLLNIQQPALELSRLRGARQSELRRRTAMGTDPQAPGLLADVTGEIETDPYTGAAEQERIAGIEGRQQARREFLSPEETEVRGVELQDALARVLFPEMVKGQFNVAQEQARAGGVIGGAQARAEAQAYTQEATAARQRETSAATSARQGRNIQVNDLLRRALGLDRQAEKATGLFGTGLFSGRQKLQNEAAALRTQATNVPTMGAAGPELGVGDESDVIELDLSPEELEQLQTLLGR